MKIGREQAIIGGAVIVIVLIALIAGGLFSVIPVDRYAYQGSVFTVKFSTPATAISKTANCITSPNGKAFIVQNVQIKDDDTGQVFTQLPSNAFPNCYDPSYDWTTTYTPTQAHHYTLTSVVKDGTTNNNIVTDLWPIQVLPVTSPVCTTGQKKCDTGNSNFLVSCSNGQYTKWDQNCPAGCVDPGQGNAYCKNVCTPGSYQCVSDAQYQLCKADGSNWGDVGICQYTYPLKTSCLAGQPNPCVMQTPRCGDGICSPTETQASCSADCGSPGTNNSGGNGGSGGNNICTTDPNTMNQATFCSCFPSAVQCQGRTDWTLVGGIVLGVALILGGAYVLGQRKKN